jgi:hypothetical protein
MMAKNTSVGPADAHVKYRNLLLAVQAIRYPSPAPKIIFCSCRTPKLVTSLIRLFLKHDFLPVICDHFRVLVLNGAWYIIALSICTLFILSDGVICLVIELLSVKLQADKNSAYSAFSPIFWPTC